MLTSQCIFFFFNDTATTEIYTLSLHDALPIWPRRDRRGAHPRGRRYEGDGPQDRLLGDAHPRPVSTLRAGDLPEYSAGEGLGERPGGARDGLPQGGRPGGHERGSSDLRRQARGPRPRRRLRPARPREGHLRRGYRDAGGARGRGQDPPVGPLRDRVRRRRRRPPRPRSHRRGSLDPPVGHRGLYTQARKGGLHRAPQEREDPGAYRSYARDWQTIEELGVGGVG